MLKKLKQLNTKGFTIIEVLIVLAIAGLILLIVFLAVPALQRNSRNTQRKNDITGILGGVAEYSNNNNGKIPDTIVLASTPPAGCITNNGTWVVSNAACSATNLGTPINIGYYTTAGSVTFGACAAAGCGLTADVSKAQMMSNAVCATSSTITNAGASTRNVAILYAIEPGSTPQCQAS